MRLVSTPIPLLLFAVFVLILQVSPSTAQSCLIADYPFNGNALDASGNGYNGTVNGATLTTDRFGNPNAAYEFDGVDD
jgi:hypothetical protein